MNYDDYQAELDALAQEAQDYYCLLCSAIKADAIYEDAIIDTIGKYGFDLIRQFRLIESCGIINGRKLYAI
jgi:hypothetical protein